ncbi:MAG TPA: YdeI/OmpD-associated family protein [Pirellulaceae bacterium]|nr:YdeI/OmpD-associated family protein [Pirellulaceae bacterium]HMO92563.1 YdeI/OmpD-associated family protein [Pirellulaceae bacterium]HMP70639.1 YdeI/OmpD-associated family protein [Pirellulaceae bacterium]
MGSKDPRVDKYIEQAPDYAKPILNKLRILVHKGCPEVQETIKWGMPSFDFKGPLCSMAAFKKHCGFSFWKSALIFDENKKYSENELRLKWGTTEKGSDCAHITNIKDLPTDAKFLALLKKAVKLNQEGIKLPPNLKSREALPMPKDFEMALKAVKPAKANFDRLAPSHKREYIEWIIEAKRQETRLNRIATAVEWIAEGKSRNWKYQK